MRKLILLLAFLLLSACGSGSTVTTGETVTNVTAETPTGTLRVSFAPEQDAPRTVAKVITKQVRIVVINQTLRVNGAIFRAIQDVAPGDTVSFALPMARGYTIEAIAYTTDSDTGLNTILRYAVARSVAVGSEEAGATLTLTDVSARLILPPGGVVQNGRYYVQANYSTGLGRQVTPLYSGWYLVPPKLSSYAGFTNDTSATNYNSTHFFIAPLTGVAGRNLYFQGVFTLKPTLLKDAESMKKWVFNYPSPSFANVSTPVLTPTNFVITTPTF
jgi:hypothetical protein